MAGILYVVATPIGNLEDVTLRALRILRDVSLIAAEDTRRTARLLQHYSISTRTTSLHAHNEHEKAQQLVDRLQAGESIALVSDAGTPLVSEERSLFLDDGGAAKTTTIVRPQTGTLPGLLDTSASALSDVLEGIVIKNS